MSTSTDASPSISIIIKGPSTLKLTLSLPSTSLVSALKLAIFEASPEFPIDQQRLIYSGRVLKDEDALVDKYGLKDGHTIHLVKGAKPVNSSAAASVPSTFSAGQQIAGNPLAPLLAAQNAGALGSFNPFAEMGINTNDPNYMQNMMNDPAVAENMGNMLRNPAVIDQVIASNPQLAAMGPQVRELMQSEQFRSFLTNPEAMRQMMAMQGGMGGNPFGGGGMGGGGGGATAGGSTGTPAALFNPWAPTPAAAPPTAGLQNPFAGGAGGGAADLQRMMAQMYGAGGPAGGFGGFGGGGGASPAAPAGPQVSAEERYQSQLETLAGMGFVDAGRNVRALMASGGNVEGAIEWLFSN